MASFPINACRLPHLFPSLSNLTRPPPSAPPQPKGPMSPASQPQGRRRRRTPPPSPTTNPHAFALRFLAQPKSAPKCFNSDNLGESPPADQNLPRRHNPPASSTRDADPKCLTKVLTLPTILTLGRVAAVPILLCTFYIDSWLGATATTSIFIAAAITDWLDGYLARKMKLASVFGAFLDPVADKLMVAATLVLLCTRPVELNVVGQFPWLMTVPAIAIIGREITMSAVREWAASQDSKLLEAVAVNNLGKWKTASQMTALTILLATRDSSIGGQGLIGTGVALLYISSGLAVWSLVVYMKKIWKVLLK